MNTKLIVIDDEKNIRETIRDYFEDAGWSVEAFCSGEDALQYLENGSSEYIIVDGRLPGMTGTEFILRANSVKTGIKYIIYTGSSDFEINDDLHAIGISKKNIVIKPAMSFRSLRTALEQIVMQGNTGE
jgi:two-component system, OmpR family, response regulator